jgi:TMEM175 potassium channel family protein
MHKGRLEAFSDGVLAIIITIMVLELRPPHDPTLAGLRPVLPILCGYALSFIYVGIYWNNHHHLLQAAHRVNGATLWANLHLLFWLSLVPFTTAWMGENHFTSAPLALYGFVLLMAGIAYVILQQLIIAAQGSHSVLKTAVGRDWKGKASPALYTTAVVCAFWSPVVSQVIYALVALMWLIPDRRIERTLAREEKAG